MREFGPQLAARERTEKERNNALIGFALSLLAHIGGAFAGAEYVEDIKQKARQEAKEKNPDNISMFLPNSEEELIKFTLEHAGIFTVDELYKSPEKINRIDMGLFFLQHEYLEKQITAKQAQSAYKELLYKRHVLSQARKALPDDRMYVQEVLGEIVDPALFADGLRSAPQKDYIITESLLSSYLLRGTSNCVGATLALSALLDSDIPVHLQDFSDHVRPLVDIGRERYVAEPGKLLTLLEETDARGTVIIENARVAFLKLPGVKPKTITIGGEDTLGDQPDYVEKALRGLVYKKTRGGDFHDPSLPIPKRRAAESDIPTQADRQRISYDEHSWSTPPAKTTSDRSTKSPQDIIKDAVAAIAAENTPQKPKDDDIADREILALSVEQATALTISSRYIESLLKKRVEATDPKVIAMLKKELFDQYKTLSSLNIANDYIKNYGLKMPETLRDALRDFWDSYNEQHEKDFATLTEKAQKKIMDLLKENGVLSFNADMSKETQEIDTYIAPHIVVATDQLSDFVKNKILPQLSEMKKHKQSLMTVDLAEAQYGSDDVSMVLELLRNFPPEFLHIRGYAPLSHIALIADKSPTFKLVWHNPPMDADVTAIKHLVDDGRVQLYDDETVSVNPNKFSMVDKKTMRIVRGNTVDLYEQYGKDFWEEYVVRNALVSAVDKTCALDTSLPRDSMDPGEDLLNNDDMRRIGKRLRDAGIQIIDNSSSFLSYLSEYDWVNEWIASGMEFGEWLIFRGEVEMDKLKVIANTFKEFRFYKANLNFNNDSVLTDKRIAFERSNMRHIEKIVSDDFRKQNDVYFVINNDGTEKMLKFFKYERDYLKSNGFEPSNSNPHRETSQEIIFFTFVNKKTGKFNKFAISGRYTSRQIAQFTKDFGIEQISISPYNGDIIKNITPFLEAGITVGLDHDDNNNPYFEVDQATGTVFRNKKATTTR